MYELLGKVAVVTGTANPNGIGFAISRQLCEEGCTVLLTDLNGEAVAERASELCQAGFQTEGCRVDMSDYASVSSFADRAWSEYGNVDIAILNHVAPTGGVGHSLLDPDPSEWELHTRVNLYGVIYGIKAFVPRMIASGRHCHVMATSSGAGGTGTMYGNGPYAVSKAGIISVMECLYGQLRDEGADVVASLIFPGVTDTHGDPERGKQIVEFMRAYGLPATLTQPAEVAEVVLEAIHTDSFWARHRLDDPAHQETVEWEARMQRTKAEANIERNQPDAYLWGPPSRLLGP